MQSIVLIGRRWFERTNGNTYHSVEVYVDGEFVHKIPFEYGYGEQWAWTGWEWLLDNGFIEKDGVSISQWARDNDVQLVRSVTDVARKKDL